MDDYPSAPGRSVVVADQQPPTLRRLISVLIALVVAWLVVWLLPNLVERMHYASTRGRERAQADVARGELDRLNSADLGKVFGLVAKAVSPSVVHIDTTRIVRRPADELSSLFGFAPQPFAAQGQGSGVIVDAQGYIVTNNHVVDGAQQIDVRLSDGRTVAGRVIGADPLTDLAVVKVEADKLLAAEWGDSDALEVGSLVWAIGNPFGLDRSVTFGIVSAKNRRSEGNSPLQDFLQTDAAVNPGNSGGPLVNISGQIVGINTAIIGRAYQGVSFSIPSNTAREVYERLKANKRVARGWLGVALDDVTPEVASALGLEKGQRGAIVVEVIAGGPAARAGLKPTDVVVEWDGEPIDGRAALSLLVARSPINARVRVIVLRDRQRVPLEVAVGERPG